jgi:IS5 family transposase
LFGGIAAYGKELGNQTFYGFRLHLKINSIGMIQTFNLAAANVHDIHMVGELTEGDGGLLLADRAYLSQPLQRELLENQGLELSVPTKYSEPTHLQKQQLRYRKQIRRSIETVGSQLVCIFHIKKIWARDLWHLTNQIFRKVLAHTFLVMFCLKEGLKPLRFSRLITC